MPLIWIILILLLVGGGGGWYGYNTWGAGGGIGILGVVLLIFVLYFVFGHLR
jgi:hypothetical protein